MKIPTQCAIGLFVLVVSARAQQIASVDLTKPPESAKDAEVQKANEQPNGCQKLLPGGFADGVVLVEQGHPQPEILVEIIRLNDLMPTLGTESQAEVRLRNSGKEPIHIPWSLDANTIQNGQDPNHVHWETGDFVVKLNGAMLANRALTQRVYSSEFSKGSQLTIQPGEWIKATIKFKFENMFSPDQPLEVGESQLSVGWEQFSRSWDVSDCKVMHGNWKYSYKQINPTVAIRLKSDSPSKGQHNNE
jgi:hypothetical protein